MVASAATRNPGEAASTGGRRLAAPGLGLAAPPPPSPPLAAPPPPPPPPPPLAAPPAAGCGSVETMSGRPRRSGQYTPAATTPRSTASRRSTSRGYGMTLGSGFVLFGEIRTCVGRRCAKAEV